MATPKVQKGTYRMAHTNFWKVIRKFGKDAHQEALVMLHLETGPLAHYSGLYQISIHDIAAYCCMSLKDAENAIHGLSNRGLIVWDETRQLVYVRNMAYRQLGRNELNAKDITGICYHAERMPEDSPAVQAFVIDYSKAYQDIEDFFIGRVELYEAS